MPSDGLQASHTPAAIRRRLSQGPTQSYLRDFTYGAIDGAVTTFAVVSGVAGAQLPGRVVIILGLANLIGDGFSMAASNYLGVRAERQQRERLRAEEEAHIAEYPAGEREEIRQIFERKGFSNDDLDRVVRVITSDRERWVETMLAEEHGISSGGPIPWRAAAWTFAAFLLAGSIPLAPFLFGHASYLWSAALTGAAFFLVGAVKSRFVAQPWWAAGLETLALGGGAAGLAYVVGLLLRDVAP
ncbi:MAG: VIT1/CCC1 transporter family protein [Bryobacterales bacterium]